MSVWERTGTYICEAVQPHSEESQQEGLCSSNFLRIFCTHKKLKPKAFPVCTIKVTVPSFPYTASGLTRFRIYAALSAGDGEGPDQTINQLFWGCIWIFPQEKNISSQARSPWTPVLFSDQQQTSREQHSNKPNALRYFPGMGSFSKSRSQVPTYGIQCNVTHRELPQSGGFRVGRWVLFRFFLAQL